MNKQTTHSWFRQLIRVPKSVIRKVSQSNDKVLDLGPCRALRPFDERVDEIRPRIPTEDRDVFDTVMALVDQDQLAQLQDRYRDDFDPNSPLTDPAKYLDIPYWTVDKLVRAKRFGLLDGRPRRVLDLGCGAGHFGAVCRALGHDYVGLDLSYEIADKIAAMLDVDRRIYTIKPREPLPDTLGRFDLVTAFATRFHHVDTKSNGEWVVWNVEDWDYFLRDLTGNHMRYPGTLHLQIVRRHTSDGKKVPLTDLLKRFRKIGARTLAHRTRIWLDVNGETGLL